MKTSTEIGSISKIVGLEKSVELCGKAGFDAWDFSMFDMCRIDKTTRLPLYNPNELNGVHYLKFARKLKKIGLDNGIVCNQSHAPFPVSVPAIRCNTSAHRHKKSPVHNLLRKGRIKSAVPPMFLKATP